MDDLIRRLEQQYPQIAGDLLPPLLALLDEAEREFGGDLQKFHIVLAVALRTAAHPQIRSIDTAAGRPPDETRLPSLGTNVHSLAQSLGIPEETVRRKVMALVRSGWLEKYDHTLGYTLAGWTAMQPLRGKMLRLAVANHRMVEAALRRPLEPNRAAEA